MLIFYLFAFIIFGAGLSMLFIRNILYHAFLLLIVLLSVSAIYIFAGADFLAITQIVVYVGGVLVLLLFGIMLTSKDENIIQEYTQPKTQNQRLFWGILVGLSLFVTLAFNIWKTDFTNLSWIKKAEVNTQTTTVYQLGIGFMTDYILVFELVALLLLIALIGSTLIAGKK